MTHGVPPAAVVLFRSTTNLPLWERHSSVCGLPHCGAGPRPRAGLVAPPEAACEAAAAQGAAPQLLLRPLRCIAPDIITPGFRSAHPTKGEVAASKYFEGSVCSRPSLAEPSSWPPWRAGV